PRRGVRAPRDVVPAMHGPQPPDWGEANRTYLLATVAVVKEQLSRHANAKPSAHSASSPPDPDSAAFQAAPPALERVATVFGLSSFERDVLLLCAGMELDPEFGALCAAAQGGSRQACPTFALAL